MTNEIDKSKGAPPSPSPSSPIDAPTYYCKRGIELAEVLYIWRVPHRRASAVEYIMRAGDKDKSKEIEDLKKAIRNLNLELEYMEKYHDGN